MRKTAVTMAALLLAASAVTAPPAAAGEIGGCFGDSCYTVIPTSATWPEAEAICEERDQHLVTINSVEENQFVYNLIAHHARGLGPLVAGRRRRGDRRNLRMGHRRAVRLHQLGPRQPGRRRVGPRRGLPGDRWPLGTKRTDAVDRLAVRGRRQRIDAPVRVRVHVSEPRHGCLRRA